MAQIYSVLIPFYIGNKDKKINEIATISLLLSNVNVGNKHPELLKELIFEKNPDIIILLEVSKTFLTDLNIRQIYTSSIEYPRNDAFGIAMFSKNLALKEEPSLHLIMKNVSPTIFAEANIKGELVRLIACHPFPPINSSATLISQAHTSLIAKEISKSPISSILGCDLNLTPFSATYKNLTQMTNMKNASEGFGYFRTWHTRSSFVRFGIDHILTKGDLLVKNFERLSDIGSDHFPILVTIAVSRSSS